MRDFSLPVSYWPYGEKRTAAAADPPLQYLISVPKKIVISN